MADLKNLGLLGAGAAGAVALTFGAAGIAGAQDDEPILTDPATGSVDDAPTTTTDDAGSGHHRGDRGERRQAMVDQLVEDGVITQDQADDATAVRDAVQAQREEMRAEKQQAIADALGVTVEDLEAAREAGTSLADLAGDDLPALVDLFTAEATDRIESAVTDGKITQEQADERLDGLAERIQSSIQRTHAWHRPPIRLGTRSGRDDVRRIEDGGGFGGRGEGGRGHGRHGDGPRGAFGPGADDAPAVVEEASLTLS